MQICIKTHLFTFPNRYYEGWRLSASEAIALNRLMAENVRNNVDQWVPRGALAPGEHAALQARIEGYAAGYQFASRLPADARSALEQAIDQIILERWGAVEPQRLEALRADPGLAVLAQTRLRLEAQAADEFLASLA